MAIQPAPTIYLGDGLYATFDGFSIWLRTLEGHKVALEPEVLRELDKYRAAIDNAYNVKRYAPIRVEL